MKLALSSLLLLVGVSALAQEIIVPSEIASRETLRLSAEQSTLRFAGLDLFPHVSGMVNYDDNILISHANPMNDFVWTFSPGLTLAAGDVGAYLPGSVTLEQLRNLLYYSTVDDVSKPSRFFALDYTPSFNVYTLHSVNDNTGQSAKFSGGLGPGRRFYRRVRQRHWCRRPYSSVPLRCQFALPVRLDRPHIPGNQRTI